MVATGRLGESREWGIIDKKGHFTVALGPNRIRPEARASHFAGRAIFSVVLGDDTYFIDAYGNRAPGIEKADEDYDRQRARMCIGGAMIIGDGERFGIARRSGEVLVPAVHRAINCYRNGLAWAPDETIGKWCPIGPDGRFRDAPPCQKVHYPTRRSHSGPEPMADDPFESSVLWVRARLRYGLHLRDTPPRWISTMRF